MTPPLPSQRPPAPPLPQPVRVQKPSFWSREVLLPRLEAADLLGARGLALAGGIVTLLGVVFFFALAASNGWIGPVERVLLGAAASAIVFAAGVVAYARHGRLDAAVTAVGVGIAGGYATLLFAAARYELVPAARGTRHRRGDRGDRGGALAALVVGDRRGLRAHRRHVRPGGRPARRRRDHCRRGLRRARVPRRGGRRRLTALGRAPGRCAGPSACRSCSRSSSPRASRRGRACSSSRPHSACSTSAPASPGSCASRAPGSTASPASTPAATSR